MSYSSSSPFASTPEAPYWVVAFSSTRTAGDDGYDKMAARMVELALQQPGCLGAESARDANGFGITNSYWKDEDSLKAWKGVMIHAAAQQAGRDRWYETYQVRVGRIERAYGFSRLAAAQELQET